MARYPKVISERVAWTAVGHGCRPFYSQLRWSDKNPRGRSKKRFPSTTRSVKTLTLERLSARELADRRDDESPVCATFDVASLVQSLKTASSNDHRFATMVPHQEIGDTPDITILNHATAQNRHLVKCRPLTRGALATNHAINRPNINAEDS
jgi:hypothetical protein